MRAGIALGSNLGDRRSTLQAARAQILRLASAGEPFKCAPLYETEPVNCEPGAKKFLNTVIEIEFEKEPRVLLRALRKIEADLGRPSHHQRNVSRTVDLDLLYAGNRVMDDEELQLPHPRMTMRRFVLAPLADIQPDLILPGHSHTVAELLQTLSAEPAVLRVAERW